MTSPGHDDATERRSGNEALDGDLGPAQRLLSVLRAVVFWTAVFLPFAMGATLLSGLDSPGDWQLFAVLLVTSVVALYLGPVREAT